MLTGKQYEGIGRLTIAFNEIEAVVEAYLPHVVQFSKTAVSAEHGSPRNFSKKMQALTAALEAVSAAHDAAYVGGILKVLDSANRLAAKRNQYVHAVALLDFTTNTRLLRMRSGTQPPDEKQIFELANEASFIASKLVEECEDLLGMYGTAEEDDLELGLPVDWNED